MSQPVSQPNSDNVADNLTDNLPDKLATATTDVIFIEGLKVDAVIGVLQWERQITQPLFIDVSMSFDVSRAAQTDNVEDTVSYKSVCDDITLWCQQTKAQLLERLAVLIADNLLQKYPITQVSVKIAKPTAIYEAASVGVKVSRSAKTMQQNGQ
ncbi:dihydroneopterin aldolase [Psychrobacter sp. I-STPA10]|uniref:dihydroneopterin aldolase n=1 Tax=Psychrobacter sp. I-STPA10 TaxID=2585769 RepID=UPI001E3ACFC4|nr:dihydroneopterin aldolase [Psychrobacter sp. I-STPA10]